jgi:hypothetical protein
MTIALLLIILGVTVWLVHKTNVAMHAMTMQHRSLLLQLFRVEACLEITWSDDPARERRGFNDLLPGPLAGPPLLDTVEKVLDMVQRDQQAVQQHPVLSIWYGWYRKRRSALF